MSDKSKRNLTITGHGDAGGGDYETVKITGEGRVSGNLVCHSLRSTGNSVFHGDVKADGISSTGNMTVHGDLMSADKTKFSGNMIVNGSLTFGKLETGGNLEVSGRVSGEELELRGYMKLEGDCEAERVNARGSFAVGGLLNAGELDIKLFGPCSAAEIGGDRVTVRLAGVLGILNRWFKPLHQSILTVDVIEGDEIHLENTRARVVRGNRVTIGSGCEIGLVEYKTDFRQTDPNTIVKENRKL